MATILLLMRFDDSPVLRTVDAAVRTAAARFGRDVVRADDRDYTGELWANVALCLRNSDLVIAVLDEVERRDCDANVMIELGFALGSGRRCLLLKELRSAPLPAVLRHRLSRNFDVFDLPGSVDVQVAGWLERDIGLEPVEPHRSLR